MAWSWVLFWDSNHEWAHKFGHSRYAGNYLIFEAEIAINRSTYDIYGNVKHKLELKEVWDELKNKNAGLTNSQVRVADIIEYMKKIGIFPYNSIRAADNPDRQNQLPFGGNKGEYMFLNERVQICLISKINLS